MKLLGTCLRSKICNLGYLPRNRLIHTVDINKSLDDFPRRHIGPNAAERNTMLKICGQANLNELVRTIIPHAIITDQEGTSKRCGFEGLGEQELLAHMQSIASQNKVYRNFIGLGYYPTITPPVIQRNILENPGWYTQYTPYQPEISQGRLESLLNFQTLVTELTGLPVANASLLDEGTAAAEAMQLCAAAAKPKHRTFLVDQNIFPQTVACVKNRAGPLSITVKVVDMANFDFSEHKESLCGVLVQYPDSNGSINNWKALAEKAHNEGAKVVVAADLLALTLLTPPGEFGADIAVGSTQRFGIPLGYGGPHAAYFATQDQHKRRMPGRLVGVSKDRLDHRALRLALQTREQHIRREKATSNICTAQALLANMAAMYAVYHGPVGLSRIASKIHLQTKYLAEQLFALRFTIVNSTFFDTLVISTPSASQIVKSALASGINLRSFNESLNLVGVSLNETTTSSDMADLLAVFAAHAPKAAAVSNGQTAPVGIPDNAKRHSKFLQQAVFSAQHSETQMLRYITNLQSKDLSLCQAMIPLGSCTMKLNATSEMMPLTWPGFSEIHPFAPSEQTQGYSAMLQELSKILARLTGFESVSLQPNSGAQGEYAGLRVVRAYHESQGQDQRNVCLIPVSAHGTNPASAAMAGFEVVVVKCTTEGALDMGDLQEKINAHRDRIAAIMITYPSTYGVFDNDIVEICERVHSAGGQVYMDGANLNAQIGLTTPGAIGADVLHMNLHKTFCIPHGGGGPGMGPIAVRAHLAPFLPGHPFANNEPTQIGPVSAAPFGSASILTISYAYLKMMGHDGLRLATQVALLNANYLKKELETHFKIRFKNDNNRCAHEFIIDCAPFEKSCGIKAADIAKRLHDYSFHSPTMSFPVANTLMIEPTESEPKQELDRFIDAMIQIRKEIQMVQDGKWPRDNNPLVNAPHPVATLLDDAWDKKYPYSRAIAAYPIPSLRVQKFWPTTNRVDDTFGDRNLVCTCPDTALYA